MSIDFPSSPNSGDTYSFAGKTWTFNGSGWIGQAASSSSGGSSSPAISPFDGEDGQPGPPGPVGSEFVRTNYPNNFTAGYSATSFDNGTKTTGTFTPDPRNGNIQHYTNGGAHTLAPPTSSCTMVIEVTNSSAGAITTSGFSLVTGDTYDTTGTNKHLFYITKSSAQSHLHIVFVGTISDTLAAGDLPYVFNTATSGDPGSGKFLFNNATFASATQFNISETDHNALARATLLAAIDDAYVVTKKAFVIITRRNGTAYFAFYITSVLTDQGTYDTYTITPITSAGSWANNDIATITIVPLHTSEIVPSFAVHKNGSTQGSLTNHGYTDVTWGTEQVDNGNNFASNVFTAPVAGNYLFATQLFFISNNSDLQTNNGFGAAMIQVNSANSGQGLTVTSSINFVVATVTKVVPLAAGDVVKVQGYIDCNTDTSQTVIDGASYNSFFSGALLR